MSDIVTTNPNNRLYFCGRGWYYHPTHNKWARITTDRLKVIWHDKDYVYNYRLGDNVRSLSKKLWVKTKQQDVPVHIYNRLEAL